MSEQSEAPAPAGRGAGGQHVCQFPVGYDPAAEEFEWHGEDLAAGERRPGQKALYCGRMVVDPDGVQRKHDRGGAFQRRRELQLEAAGKPVTRRDQGPARPVTSARASLSELLVNWEAQAKAHASQFGDLLDRVEQIVAAAGDPDAAVAEVAAVRRDAKADIDAANDRAEEAEAEVTATRRALARVEEENALAVGAAEDAIAERDAQIATAEAAATEADRLRTQLEEVQADARRRIETAKREALELVEKAENDAEKRVALEKRAADARIERSEEAAARQITEANDARDAALSAQQRAETERARMEQARDDAVTDATQLRSDVDAARAQLRDDVAELRQELATVRADARTDREQLRADHAADIARIQSAAEARISTLERALATAERDADRWRTQVEQTTRTREGKN